MRAAFTLMELLISVVLIVLITLFLFGAIASSKLSNDTLLKHSNTEQIRTDLFELLYRDVMESIEIASIETKDKKFNIIQMQTNNSLYEISAPYVTYFVNSRTNVLTRLESARIIKLPITYENEPFIYATDIIGGVKAFNCYTKTQDSKSSDTNSSVDENSTVSNDMRSYLIYSDIESLKSPLLFELYR